MISREEFNHQLQTGQVREALASVVQSLCELDITTQIASDADRPYIRTTIDLLSGRVVDEVSADFADDRDLYLNLQRLHAERVAASYEIARDYLERIESILSGMSAAPPDGDFAAQTLRRSFDPISCKEATPTTSSLRPYLLSPEATLRERRGSANDRASWATPAQGIAGQREIGAAPAQCIAPNERPTSVQPKSPPPALVAKLQQARASLTSRLGGDTAPAMLFPSRTADIAPPPEEECELARFSDESDDTEIVLTPSTPESGLSEDDLAAVTTIVDEEIDLAIALSAGYANEENGEVWAGWVEEDSEDEDEYGLEASSPQPPAHPTLLDWQEIPTPKYVDAIEVKPIVPRSTDRSLDPIAQWDKFEPDYLGIDFDPQPTRYPPK